ncbi:hypothetical protein HDU82_001813 [Entophlyctis luteolus]|nr:hypothetical protein HDU82_001813 [Entophlyctis luteolus]
MFGFARAKRTPLDLVRGVRDGLARIAAPGGADRRKTNEEISKNLVLMKAILYGDGGRIPNLLLWSTDLCKVSDPSPELVAQLSHEIYNNDILPLLVANMSKFEFEAKKDVSQIFNNLLRRQIGTRFPTAEYIAGKPEILMVLLKGYENQDIALNCGMILRECIRHEVLAKQILETSNFWNFFSYVELSTFDVASDAFATFKDLLTKHKILVSAFLNERYDEFFAKYTLLLNSSNYVTKRQSLKLLGEILLDRTNYTVMAKYISSADNLKLMMNLLRDKSRNIQFEAFHVFKVFVANPNKAKPILDILQKNKEKLVTYLTGFHNDRAGNVLYHYSLLDNLFAALTNHLFYGGVDDETFADEKAFLIKAIQEM